MALLAAFLVASAGCWLHAAPPDAADFSPIAKLDALDGVYRNRGETAAGEPPRFLSGLLWPGDASLDHEAIVAIEIRAAGAHALAATAIGAHGPVRQRNLAEGDDFERDSGRLRFEARGAFLSYGGDDPLVGPRRESAEFGLDTQGHGKLQRSASSVGLVYLILPVAFRVVEEVRFERIGD